MSIVFVLVQSDSGFTPGVGELIKSSINSFLDK
jgi:hypothetical protein